MVEIICGNEWGGNDCVRGHPRGAGRYYRRTYIPTIVDKSFSLIAMIMLRNKETHLTQID
jgi:hypothetical protein